MHDLKGKKALVTGGSRGIGEAIALSLAERGADVAITYEQSAERAAGVVRRIQEAGQRGLAIQANSADPVAIKRAVSTTVDTLGGLDILVNNAAIAHAGTLEETSVEDLQALLDVNVRGPMLFAKAAIPHLDTGGRIISIGSSLGERVPFGGVTAYSTTKSALLSLTRGLSRELGPRGITVNLVQPGPVDTDMNPAQGEMADTIRSLTSLGRYGQPKEIGSLVAFLASPSAQLVTGTIISADAGLNA